MKALWLWLTAKLGRLVTATGGLLALADLDISPIKDSLEGYFSHKAVQGLTAALFIASYLRHQYVASKVAPKP